MFVAHFYQLARTLHAGQRDDALLLRADRQPNATRHFRLTEGARRSPANSQRSGVHRPFKIRVSG